MPKEDVLLRVEGVDDDVHDARNLGLELVFLGLGRGFGHAKPEGPLCDWGSMAEGNRPPRHVQAGRGCRAEDEVSHRGKHHWRGMARGGACLGFAAWCL